MPEKQRVHELVDGKRCGNGDDKGDPPADIDAAPGALDTHETVAQRTQDGTELERSHRGVEELAQRHHGERPQDRSENPSHQHRSR